MRDRISCFCCCDCEPDHYRFFDQQYFARSQTSRYITKQTSNDTKEILTYKTGLHKYTVEVVVGDGKAEMVDGRAEECSFNNPQGIVVHEPSHSCFVADNHNHSVRKILFAKPN